MIRKPMYLARTVHNSLRPPKVLTEIPQNTFLITVMVLAFSIAATGTNIEAARAGQPLPQFDPFEVRITAEEIPFLIHDLQLNSEQQTLVKSMFQGFEPDAKRSQVAALKQSMFLKQALKGDSRGTVILFQRMAEANRAWHIERRGIEDRFLADVRTILTEDQQKHWPTYETNRRRRWTLAERAELGGEGVDLVALTNEIIKDSQTRSALQPTLNDYARELDVSLRDRNRALNGIEDKTAEREHPSGETLFPLFRQAGRARLAIVDLNTKYAQLLETKLSAESADMLRSSFERAAFPSIFAETAADRYLELALALDDLLDSQRASIESTGDRYREKVLHVNRGLASLTGKLQRRQTSRAGEITSEKSDNDELSAQLTTRIDEEHNSKRKIVERAINEIFDVLNEEQRARLPKPDVDISQENLIAAMIDDALNFASTDLRLPEGFDRADFVQAVREATRGLRFQQLAVTGGQIGPNGKPEPIAVTGSNAETGSTTTVPIDLNNNDDTKKDESRGPDSDGPGG